MELLIIYAFLTISLSFLCSILEAVLLNINLSFIKIKNNILSVSTEDGKNECGFGYAVRADANYILIDNFVPEYYTTGEDSKIYFESFYNEK